MFNDRHKLYMMGTGFKYVITKCHTRYTRSLFAQKVKNQLNAFGYINNIILSKEKTVS